VCVCFHIYGGDVVIINANIIIRIYRVIGYVCVCFLLFSVSSASSQRLAFCCGGRYTQLMSEMFTEFTYIRLGGVEEGVGRDYMVASTVYSVVYTHMYYVYMPVLYKRVCFCMFVCRVCVVRNWYLTAVMIRGWQIIAHSDAESTRRTLCMYVDLRTIKDGQLFDTPLLVADGWTGWRELRADSRESEAFHGIHDWEYHVINRVIDTNHHRSLTHLPKPP